jgi:hypothetical protein
MGRSRSVRAVRGFLLVLPLAALRYPASAQEFEFGLIAPSGLKENSTFEVLFTITSRGVPAGKPGAQGWSLGVAHKGLTLISATTAGTAAADLMSGGFNFTEKTRSSPARPENDGFVSAVVLSGGDGPVTLPPSGTVTVARATYRVERSACFGGASIEVTDDLVGSGQPVRNAVTWDGRTFFPTLGRKGYAGCDLNDYQLSVLVPGAPLSARLGERMRLEARVVLFQAVGSASGWTLAVAHDPARLNLIGVDLVGTGLEELLGQDGFALFEITAGPRNSGFTAQGELRSPGKALPAPSQALARARYEMAPFMDPGQIGTRIETTLTFPASLNGSGGPVANAVFPEGNLTAVPLDVSIALLPQALFIRGDSNGDGRVDISDALAVLFYLFGGGAALCEEAANANNDSHLDLTDAVTILERLFLDPQPFPRPYPDCGLNPSLPSLSCAVSSCR